MSAKPPLVPKVTKVPYPAFIPLEGRIQSPTIYSQNLLKKREYQKAKAEYDAEPPVKPYGPAKPIAFGKARTRRQSGRSYPKRSSQRRALNTRKPSSRRS